MVDTKLGRRRTLMLGALIQMIAFYILGGMIYGIQKDNGGNLVGVVGAAVGAKGYVAIICIYIFAIGYEFSWGPVVWVVCSEIYPTRIRAMSLSITTGVNWAMNACIAKVTPIMIAKITYGTYFFYGSCAILMGSFAYLLLPETRGRSLEEMDEVKKYIYYHNTCTNSIYFSYSTRENFGPSKINMLLIPNKSNVMKKTESSKSKKKKKYSIIPS